jgi:NADPH:quinone reductase-like Zn-dependent oxidoreductase
VIGAKDDGTWFGPMLWLFKVAGRWILRDRQFAMCRAKGTKADLEILRDLIEAGKITPVIDRRYNLREVPQAIGYVEQGHARGKVVITV